VDLHQWLGGIGGIGRSLTRLFGALQPPVEADGAPAAPVECALFEDEHRTAKQAARGLVYPLAEQGEHVHVRGGIDQIGQLLDAGVASLP
jgi:hypothetical protein